MLILILYVVVTMITNRLDRDDELRDHRQDLGAAYIYIYIYIYMYIHIYTYMHTYIHI